jgi:hypothetical protein
VPAAARRVVVPVVAAALVLLAGLTGCDASNPEPRPPPARPSSTPADPQPAASAPAVLPAVGALFAAGHTDHFCSAAVVHSSSGDVVVTAAHCLAGTARGFRFVPGYGVSGSGPSGSWTVTAAYAPDAWLHGRDPHADYAFLTVTRADTSSVAARGRPRTVEGSVGSVGSPGPAAVGRPVTVAGYASGDHDEQIICTAPVVLDNGEPAVRCGGLGVGTSGGPWISGTSGHPGPGSLVGLVGGSHQGGCTDAVTYSPVFDAVTTRLLQRAGAGGRGDVLPAPGDDGC